MQNKRKMHVPERTQILQGLKPQYFIFKVFKVHLKCGSI